MTARSSRTAKAAPSTPTPTDKPVLKVRLDTAQGTLRMRLPKKGGRWQGPFKVVDECVQKAIKEGVPTPFLIDYVTEED